MQSDVQPDFILSEHVIAFWLSTDNVKQWYLGIVERIEEDGLTMDRYILSAYTFRNTCEIQRREVAEGVTGGLTEGISGEYIPVQYRAKHKFL